MLGNRSSWSVLAPIASPMKLVGKMNHSLRPRSMCHWSQYESLSEKKKKSQMRVNLSVAWLRTSAVPASFPTMGFAFDCSTGLIHACAGVMKSFRSVSVWFCGLIHYIDRTRVYEPTSAPEKAIEGPCVFKPKDISSTTQSWWQIVHMLMLWCQRCTW